MSSNMQEYKVEKKNIFVEDPLMQLTDYIPAEYSIFLSLAAWILTFLIPGLYILFHKADFELHKVDMEMMLWCSISVMIGLMIGLMAFRYGQKQKNALLDLDFGYQKPILFRFVL